MSTYGSDATERTDIDTNNPGVKYQYALAGGESPWLTHAERAPLQAAAASGWASLRSTWIGWQPAAQPWLDRLDAGQQAALVRLVKRAPVPV